MNKKSKTKQPVKISDTVSEVTRPTLSPDSEESSDSADLHQDHSIVITPIAEIAAKGEVNELFPFPIPISRDYAYYSGYPDDIGSVIIRIINHLSKLYDVLAGNTDEEVLVHDVLHSFTDQIKNQIRTSMEMLPHSRLAPPHEYTLGVTVIHMLSMVPDINQSAIYPIASELRDDLLLIEKHPISGSSTVPTLMHASR